MSRLRPYQNRIALDTFAEWQAGHKNVLVRAPTGSGKTVIVGHMVRTVARASAVIAHRGELVTQLATAMARERIPHRIIGPSTLQRQCQAVQVAELGQHWVDPGARVGVAGIDTLVKRDTSNDSWFREVTLWAGDECHHFLKANKWGRGVDLFPNPAILGLGYTATPGRADGKGLSFASDGLFHAMVEGPGERDLIDAGYLTDYRIFAPPSDVVYEGVGLGSDGDYSMPQLRAAVHRSDQFVGDIVKHYLRIAPGKRGITFAVDVESATEIARAFRAAGVTAEVVSGKTDPVNRVRILQSFRRGDILQLVNVDLFGEGFDVPAVEVVSMGRKTESLALFMQQFGRALRLMIDKSLEPHWDTYTDEQRRAFIAASVKPKAIIIDHVQNIHRHGLPDSQRVWSLDPRNRKSNGVSDAIPTRTCANKDWPRGSGLPCLYVYERFRKVCPNCDQPPVILDRTAPEFVDGDLFELSPETLAALRGRVAQIDAAPPLMGNPGAQAGVNRNHQNRIIAQHALRDTISLWSGWQLQKNRDASEQYRRFFHLFGVDMMTAQTLNTADAQALEAKVAMVLARERVQRMI